MRFSVRCRGLLCGSALLLLTACQSVGTSVSTMADGFSDIPGFRFASSTATRTSRDAGLRSGESKEGIQPEITTTFVERQPVYGKRLMAVTPHPLATRAAYDILRRGGTAVDAAAAAQIMLTLVEPAASGIGGGGFMLVYDNKTGRVTSYDGRETAPDSARPDMFLKANGAPMEFYDAVAGGTAVGIPGMVKLLEVAHANHGRLTWYDLIKPTVDRARSGFPVSERLAQQIAEDPSLKATPAARAYFYLANGKPLPEGHLLRNPALAEALSGIASNGSRAFYADTLTDDMIKTVRTAPRHPARLTISDFVNYEVEQRDALCGNYRSYTVCGMAPPSAGGIVTLQVLKFLEKYDLKKAGVESPETLHLLAEASKLAYADRNRYIADPRFVRYNQLNLLEPTYLATRARLLSPARSMGIATAGSIPGQREAAAWTQFEPVSTSHISVVDMAGNAVSLTGSIENTFGSRLFTNGFLLNNQLTDFAFMPSVGGVPVANRAEPGKRPRSSMSPTLVFDRKTGALRFVVGSPGGARITPYVLKTLVQTLDGGQNIQAAISSGNIANLNDVTELEEGRFPRRTFAALKAKGDAVVAANLSSGINAIERRADGTLVGGTDPRREGLALGE
jgi:gamma-glutamyltranspeptidase / glutathione hydrolase